MIRIAITGPECTGKSTLTEQLAAYFNSQYFPEYARDYISSLNRDYTYKDILHIAETQLKQANDEANGDIVFFDTWLIITKVWFDVVYGHYPGWMDDEIRRNTMDLYLLCDTAIPWSPDKVRENGGEMRELLFQRYADELTQNGCRYEIIHGTGKERFMNAVKAIEHYFPDICHNK